MALTANEDGTSTIELSVQGMHCGSCAALIEETLIENPNIPAVAVDLDAERAAITFRTDALSVEEICAAVAEVGYPATPVDS